MIFAICGLWLILTQTNGPFDLFLKIKLYLFRNKYVGVFFAKLFECPICLGFHLGYIVGILSLFNIVLPSSILIYLLFCALEGSVYCLLTSLILDLIIKEREKL